MFTCKCDRCGSVRPITQMQQIVSFDGRKLLWVCADDRN